MSEAAFKRNLEVMSTFKVGQNVVLHPQPATFSNKQYGTITGFELNSLGEVVLVINVARYEKVDIVKLHPFNQITVVERVTHLN